MAIPSVGLSCHFSGKALREDEALFLTCSPDGVLIVDLKNNLPAEHICIEGRGSVVQKVIKCGVLQDFFGKSLKIPPDFVERIHGLLKSNAINMLCLARKSGVIIFGFEKVLAALNAGEVEFLLQAIDGKKSGKEKTRLNAGDVRIFSVFNSEELGGVIRRQRVVHMAVLSGNPNLSRSILSLITKIRDF